MSTRVCSALALVCLLLVMAQRAEAQPAGLGAGAELVDPKVLRVCADPRDLPYSDMQGRGFENKIAVMFAKQLGKSLAYTFYPQVIGFVRNTLDALRCDVVMGVAEGYELVQTTNPYYRTTYVLVYRPGTGLDGVDSLGDKRLQGKHIGVVAGTPPATIMASNGLMPDAQPYPLTVDTRVDAPSKTMVGDIASGKIDAGVLWGPLGGYWAKQSATKLTVVPLLKEHGAPMTFRITMGVRQSDQAWKRTLNRLIVEDRIKINALLASDGVPLLDNQGKLIAP
ncbi:MAG TPA: substrate-binding domain-containing protein [Acetobacteraceae bacterium]|jgi:quinoprotein dehydrogenase-associated probable ABC transporter substrate-binding protein|nr:substrate-binding domain-containing protein [Acetobacteraceae bacterium]